MDKIVLFCKSFSGDISRAIALANSYSQFCIDKSLLFYFSVPNEDLALFTREIKPLDSRIRLLTDEDILGRNLKDSWHSQQIVKYEFFKQKLCQNYFWIDSDFIFIKKFCADDFFAYDNVPYFVCSSFGFDVVSRFAQKRALGPNYDTMVNQVRNAVLQIQKTFNRSGPVLSFGAPAIWNCKILMEMDNWLTKKNISFDWLISKIPFELNWYGEFALSFNIIPIVPHHGYGFRITTNEQAQLLGNIGINSSVLANYGYICVCIASKWNNIKISDWLPSQK